MIHEHHNYEVDDLDPALEEITLEEDARLILHVLAEYAEKLSTKEHELSKKNSLRAKMIASYVQAIRDDIK